MENTINKISTKDIALHYRNNGLSVIPVKLETKQPTFKWKDYQSQLPTPSEISSWWSNNGELAIALICGKVSGNVEIVDIDNHFGDAQQLFDLLKDFVETSEPEDLWSKLVIESTQSGGFHLAYRCQEMTGNTKLARRIKPDGTQDTVIETRGEGGYALIAPSPKYKLLQGKFSEIEEITAYEREVLFACCKAANECEDSKGSSSISNGDYDHYTSSPQRPGADFNERGDITGLLQQHGWQLISDSQGKQHWRRPGKTRGISATFNYIPNKFYCFSSNSSPFETGRVYDRFAAFTLLEFQGDFKRAAKELYDKGYGSKNGSNSPKTKNIRKLHKDTTVFLSDLNLTDTGNAKRFFKMYNGQVKFNHTSDQWLIWNGKFWESDMLGRIVEFAKKTANSIYIEAADYEGDSRNKDALEKWAKTSQSESKIKAMLNLSKSIEGIAVTSNALDANFYYLNLRNGVFNLRDNTLIEHKPDYLISKYIDIDWQPESAQTCDNWQMALEIYFNYDYDLIEYIQKICGLTLCGEHLEELIFFLYGLGKNGKSVFIKVLEMIYGDYAQKAPVEMLMTNRNDNSIPNDVARMKGARFVVTSELPKGKRLNENRVKDLTGGDLISARFLHKEWFEFKPSHKLWIYGNHKPIIHGSDEGIWRRIILIPFVNTIPENIQKPPDELNSLFESEKEGILAWMIEGWKKYCEERKINKKLLQPESIQNAVREYREDQDILAEFFSECCNLSETSAMVKTKELYNEYVNWCNKNKEEPIKNRTFYTHIEERGFKKVDSSHGREKLYVGISLLNREPAAF